MAHYTDNFNRSNATPLDGSWTQPSWRASSCNLVSNQARASASDTDAANYSTHGAYADDQYFIIYAGTGFSSYARIGGLLRAATNTGYFMYANGSFATNGQIWRWNGSSWLQLGSNFYQPVPAVGGYYKATMAGSQIYTYTDATQYGNQTDASGYSGAPGIYAYSNDVTQSGIDDFYGGDGSGPAAGTIVPLLMAQRMMRR